MWCSVGEGMLPAATLCDRGGPSPPQRSAATPRGLAGEPVISPAATFHHDLPALVSWNLWLLEEPKAVINPVGCRPTVCQCWARRSRNPAGKGQ